MKSFFKLLEKTAGPIGLLIATAGAILDFMTPLGNYIYVLAAILLALTVLSAICTKNNPLLQKIKSSTAFAPDFIKNELIELWQPDGVVFWKKGLFQVLAFLTALTLGAGVYAKDNPKGFLATKIDSIAGLQTSLGLIDSKLGDISAKQNKIIEVIENTDRKIDLVKKETSDNPRKELANLGISWDEDSFLDSIIQNDEKTFKLFIDGGFKLTRDIQYDYYVYQIIESAKNFSILETAINSGAISKNMFTKHKLDISMAEISNLDKFYRQVEQKNNVILDKSKSYVGPSFGERKVSPLLFAIWSRNQIAVDFILSLDKKIEKEIFYANNYEEFKDSEFISSFEISIEDEARKNNIHLGADVD